MGVNHGCPGFIGVAPYVALAQRKIIGAGSGYYQRYEKEEGLFHSATPRKLIDMETICLLIKIYKRKRKKSAIKDTSVFNGIGL